MKCGEKPDPIDDKWHSSEDEDQEKEEGKSDLKPNENPTTTENPSEKPSTTENPTTEKDSSRPPEVHELFPPIPPKSPEKEKETQIQPEKEKESPIVQPEKEKATGKYLKNKKSFAKSDNKTLTAEGILQALEPIEITPMKETQKETEKETQQEKKQ